MGRERNRTNDYQKLVIDPKLLAKSDGNGRFKLYVVAAEGDKTEYHYFKELTRQYGDHWRKSNMHLIALDRPKGEVANSSPQFVKNMLEIFLQNNPNLNLQEDYDELWLIIDTDDYDNRKAIVESLAQECAGESLYHLGLSNPCFELWLILHYVDLSDCIKNYLPEHAEDCNIKEYIEKIENVRKRPKFCKELLPRVHQNQHEPYYQKLIEYIPQAIPRAKQLGDCTPTSSHYPQQVCTNIYKLVEKLNFGNVVEVMVIPEVRQGENAGLEALAVGMPTLAS